MITPLFEKGSSALSNWSLTWKWWPSARCADDAVEVLQTRKPDLIALDLSLPDGSGLPLIEHLLSVCPASKVVVLSMHDGEPYVSEALRRGASGYVTKGVAPEELVAGLRAVMEGEQFLSSDLRQRRAGRSAKARDPFHRLTTREHEVFLLLAAGRTPKQVAAELGIGQKDHLHPSRQPDGQARRRLGAGSLSLGDRARLAGHARLKWVDRRGFSQPRWPLPIQRMIVMARGPGPAPAFAWRARALPV